MERLDYLLAYTISLLLILYISSSVISKFNYSVDSGAKSITSIFTQYSATGSTKYMKIAKEVKEKNEGENSEHAQYKAVKDAMIQDGIHPNYQYIDWIIEKVNHE